MEGDALVFRLADPAHEHSAVGVWSDVELAVGPMAQVPGGWEVAIDRPDLDCLEYLLDLDGELVPDPGNPDRIDGAFAPHSWLALPGYAEPAWLALEPRPGGLSDGVWEPHDGPLPLLLVHDGPEMDRFGQITRYAATREREVRVALLAPGPRDATYSADPAYAARLVDHLLPALLEEHDTVGRPVLVGQSLGGLAALHAAWTSPAAFGGLVLQSGSFFTPELDPQESGFGYFERVTDFVASVLATATDPGLPPMAMTCGTAEENLANNRLLRDHLRAIGVDVTWGEARQGHTWTCWRDTLDPHLDAVMARAWG